MDPGRSRGQWNDHETALEDPPVVRTESLALVMCAALSLLVAACGGSTTGGKGGSGPDSNTAFREQARLQHVNL